MRSRRQMIMGHKLFKKIYRTISRFLPRRKQNSGWLSEEVRLSLKSVKKRPVSFKKKFQKLARPGGVAIWNITGGLIISFPISWLFCIWDPSPLSLGSDERLLSAYTTMWQVQAGIAAVALPILLFVIELSKDERQTATRSHEVLIRETYVFPIIVFSLAGTFRIGFDIAWFPKEAVFLLDLFLVLLGTIVLTVFAYFRALILLFSPSKMKARGMKVAREKMNESLDASIKVRIANNILFAKLEELKVGFLPFQSDRRETEQYLVLRAPSSGILSDIHLARLEEFIGGLPWKEAVWAGVVSGQESKTEEGDSLFGRQREYVWLMKRYGEQIFKKNDSLIRLDKSAFENLDGVTLETQLKSVVKMRSADED